MLKFSEESRFEIARHNMVEEQLRNRNIRDQRVLAAMASVPRQEFVDQKYRNEAYGDYPVPVAGGQTVSQPYMVALMLQSLRLHPDHSVLEIGTGTGYQAALLAQMANRVISIERIAELASEARRNLQSLGVHNVEVVVGDGSVGYSMAAPYDRIIVAAAAPSVPQALLHQLADGGILLVPVGAQDVQVVHRVERHGTEFKTELLDTCRFVPLIGEQGHR
jgi:protein-L-isoaspartate(D-aspartate) O-methyltransferase